MKPKRYKVSATVVGVPRYFISVLPSLLKSLRLAGTQHMQGFFWAYKDAHMPRTNQAVHLTPTSEDDWRFIGALPFDSLKIAQPISTISLDHSHLDHPQVSALRLNPNPTASFSWITALSRGAEGLVNRAESTSADFWIISRPDLRLSGLALRRLLSRLSKDNQWSNRSIAVAARPYAHRVLITSSGQSNLPVDHFFIGSPEAIGALAGLEEALEQLRVGADLRQPIVNEFILGQYFVDNDIHQYPVRLPYLIWRGGLWKSVFAAADRKGIPRLKAGSQSIAWNLRGFVSPGFHQQGL